MTLGDWNWWSSRRVGLFAMLTSLKVLYKQVLNNGSIGSSFAKRIPHSDEIKASSCWLTGDCQVLHARQHEVTACKSCELYVSKEHQTWMSEEPRLFMTVGYLCWNVVLGWIKKNYIFSKLPKQIGIEQGFCWACAQHRRERCWEYVSVCAQKLLLLFWRNKTEAIKQKELNPVVGDLNSGWWLSPVASRNSLCFKIKRVSATGSEARPPHRIGHCSSGGTRTDFAITPREAKSG